MRASSKAAAGSRSAASSSDRSPRRKRDRRERTVKIAPLPKRQRNEPVPDISDEMPAEINRLPKWARLGPDTNVEVWWGALDRYKIDDRNRMSLINLSQSSNIGHFEAAQCIHDITKYDPRNAPIRDFNKWFSSNLKNARQKVQKHFCLLYTSPSPRDS